MPVERKRVARDPPNDSLSHHGTRQRLSPAVERELVVAAEAGDAAACERLVDAFLPAIAGVASLYRNSPGVDRSELLQEGVVGLLRAVKRYDPGLGTPFWSYASWWVRQAMQQLVAEMTRPVVLSDRALRQLARLNEVRRDHLQAHGREPSTAELVTATGYTLEQIESLIASTRPARGLEEVVSGADGPLGTFEELVADPGAEGEYEEVVERMQIEQLPSLSETLDEREREIVYAHYGLGRRSETLQEIGGRLGLSAERVRQLEERALGKLRTAVMSPPLAHRSRPLALADE
ncbi:MAG: sigma-70 family RNA polymerase sigma factor [Solirubrobacteraceae bacterium]